MTTHDAKHLELAAAQNPDKTSTSVRRSCPQPHALSCLNLPGRRRSQWPPAAPGSCHGRSDSVSAGQQFPLFPSLFRSDTLDLQCVPQLLLWSNQAPAAMARVGTKPPKPPKATNEAASGISSSGLFAWLTAWFRVLCDADDRLFQM